VASAKPVTTGKHTLGVQFKPTGKYLKPDYFTGDVILYVDGEKAGELKDIKSGATYCSMTGYGLVIGRNIGTPVTHEYRTPFEFTGELEKVTIVFPDL
jgi:arylsulfatase